MGSSSQSTHSTTNQSVTPTNPQWMTGGLENFGHTLAGLQNLDPYSLVSGANAQQQAAGSGALSLGGVSNGVLANGTGYAAPNIYDGGGKAPSVLDNLGAYQDPYNQQVVRSTLANYDYGAGQQQAADKLSLAGMDGTFGGSGGAIQSALTNSQILRDRAQTQAGLLNQGYNTALGAATTDAQLRSAARDRAVQASTAQAQAQLQAQQMRQNSAQMLDANQRANIGAQGIAGDDLRGITQQHLAAPISTASSLAGIWGSLPLDLLHGQDSTQTQDSKTTMTPSLMSQIGQGLAMAGSLATGLGGLGVMGAGAGAGAGAAGWGSLASGIGATPNFSFNNPLSGIGG